MHHTTCDVTSGIVLGLRLEKQIEKNSAINRLISYVCYQSNRHYYTIAELLM